MGVSSSKIDTWDRNIYDQGDKDVRVAERGVECTELGGKVCKNKRFMDVQRNIVQSNTASVAIGARRSCPLATSAELVTVTRIDAYVTSSAAASAQCRDEDSQKLSIWNNANQPPAPYSTSIAPNTQ